MEQVAESTNGEVFVLGESLIQRVEVVVPREHGLVGLHDIACSSSTDDGMDIKISNEDEKLENNFYLDEDTGNCFSSENDGIAEISEQPNLNTSGDNRMVINQEGNLFSLFRTFGNRTEQKSTKKPRKWSCSECKKHLAAALHLPEDYNEFLPNENDGASVNPNVVGGMSDEHHRHGKYVDFEPRGFKSPEEWKINAGKEEARKLKGNAAGSGNVGTLHDIRNESDDQNPVHSSGTRDSKSLEVLKSVVYGGLMESITSLGIVTSAASSEATIPSIITIGLANLIGGLLMLGHNLGDLKSDKSPRASNKYHEQLGKRENFLLHVTFAVFSFLVCGLIPPATYGFTFNKIHDKNLTLKAVAVVSLLCIVLLAIGKAYTKKAEKFLTYISTIMYYVYIAIIVSGVSYAVGDFINKIMQDFGWFETKSLHPFLLDMQSTNPVTWASY